MDGSTRVGEHMAKFPLITEKDMPIQQAFEFMRKSGIRHLPVLDDGHLVGVVSERDLKYALGLNEVEMIRVEDVMAPKPYSVTAGTPLAQVVEQMADHKYGCAVVVTQSQQVIGIFTTTDGMRILADLLRSDDGGKLRLMKIEEFTFPIASNYI